MKDSPTSGHLEVLFEFDVQPAGVVCMFVVHLFEGLAPAEGVTGGVLGMSVRRRRAADTMNPPVAKVVDEPVFAGVQAV